jgi:hypothetical protein
LGQAQGKNFSSGRSMTTAVSATARPLLAASPLMLGDDRGDVIGNALQIPVRVRGHRFEMIRPDPAVEIRPKWRSRAEADFRPAFQLKGAWCTPTTRADRGS